MTAYNISSNLYSKIRPILRATRDARYMVARSYHEKVIDHYENPRNVGSFDKSDQNVGTGLVGAPACGDVMKLQILVDENGKITDAKFKTFGCGSAIASSSLATEWIKGKTVNEANTIKNQDIAKELCLPPVKLHCSMLAEDAIKAAINDYHTKKDKQQNSCILNNLNVSLENNMRVVEKHLRDEVTNRCVEFLDVIINYILYIEQIYSNDIFEKRLKYNRIVYECQDTEVQNYTADFLNRLKPLLRKRLIDQIGFVITTRNENDILRRYLIELHPIINHSSNAIHPNGNHLFAELDSIFSACLIELMRQMPISPINTTTENDDENEQVHWKLQMRLCHCENKKFEVDETFYEQFKLIENCLLPLKQIKSVHSERLDIQLMCQNRKKQNQ
ncbi:unnamed protein product [Rotaria magnacalcarata]